MLSVRSWLSILFEAYIVISRKIWHLAITERVDYLDWLMHEPLWNHFTAWQRVGFSLQNYLRLKLVADQKDAQCVVQRTIEMYELTLDGIQEELNALNKEYLDASGVEMPLGCLAVLV